jgi:Leu/Phe-tRNA-protein transferase
MNKYKVKVTHLFAEIVDIEAESPEDAKEQVVKLIQKEDFQSQPQYETTLPSEHWKVITEEEFQKLIQSFAEDMEKEQNKEESNIITP